MDTPATYVQLGFLQISVPDLVLLLAMFVAFAAALTLPFPREHEVPRLPPRG